MAARDFSQCLACDLTRYLQHRGERQKKLGANLLTLSLNSLEYTLERTLCKSRTLTSVLIALVSGTQPLGPEIERVPEWFVDAGEDISSSHKDLQVRS